MCVCVVIIGDLVSVTFIIMMRGVDSSGMNKIDTKQQRKEKDVINLFNSSSGCYESII